MFYNGKVTPMKKKGKKRRSTEGEATETLTTELELLATLLEEELLAATMTEGTALLEGIASLLRLGVIGIISIIVTGTQLRIGQDLVCLVDGGHLLLRLLLGYTLGVSLVGVVQLH